MSEHLRLHELGIQFTNQTSPVLSGVNLSVGADECHCIVGPTGSGKSSLLLAASGLLPSGACHGTVQVTSRPGAVFQNPHTQVLCDHVGPETAFALENGGVQPEAMQDMVTQALAEADLPVPTHTPTNRLSMGRQYRLVLAGALVTTPDLLLLDEPCAQLDPQGCQAVARIIERVRARGGGVLLCEHEPAALAEQITHWWRLDNGHLIPSEPFRKTDESTTLPGSPHGHTTSPDTHALLHIHDLHLTLGEKPIFSGLDLTIHPGQAVHVEGVNGSGKSTLTRVISGFLSPDSGTVSLCDTPVSPAALRGCVGLVLQNPVSQLFEDTVGQELSFAPRRKGMAAIPEKVARIADLLGITHLLENAPFLLSYGQQRLVALGACLTQEPELLILDDPFAGLDLKARSRVRNLLHQERVHRGMAVLITGHNPSSPRRFADFYTRELRLEGGRLAPVA